jgi:hypothetical protein
LKRANGKDHNIAKAAYGEVFGDREGYRMERLKKYYT